jgi:hypothetical protein
MYVIYLKEYVLVSIIVFYDSKCALVSNIFFMICLAAYLNQLNRPNNVPV